MLKRFPYRNLNLFFSRIMPNVQNYSHVIASIQLDFKAVEDIAGNLDKVQTDSINAILSEMLKQDVTLKTQQAYILATAWHESRLRPIREYGSDKYLDKYDTGKLAAELGNTPQDDDDGILYAGRGFAMITGKANYEREGKRLGIDLIHNPDLALKPEIAANILVYGMIHGSFTGKKLSLYINSGKTDFQEARRTVNGMDKAALIAGIATRFLKCIKA